jgi:NADH-quinone oxidoreductase subunit F
VVKAVAFITEHFGLYTLKNMESYLSIGGFQGLKHALKLSRNEVIEEITLSGLQGRGGAAYGTGLKWHQASGVLGDRKVVICNADEGEPCTFKDRELLSKDPFRVIEGMIIAGYAVGAQNGYIYLREEYAYMKSDLEHIIALCHQHSFLGESILESEFSFTIELYSGAGAYVCGEGSTLIESMEGKSGRPRIKPPYIKECGFNNLPTTINNVETLAAAAAILKHGYKNFTKYGTENSPGTKLISLAGHVHKPGAYEIQFGYTLRDIIEFYGGGITSNKPLLLVQVGGASGRVAPERLLDTPYTYEDFKRVGLDVGSGGILVVNTSVSIEDFLKAIQNFFDHECCGKCVPCREGNRQISKIIDRLFVHQPIEKDILKAKQLADIMKNCSFCGLGQTAQNAFLSILEHFPDTFSGQEDKV